MHSGPVFPGRGQHARHATLRVLVAAVITAAAGAPVAAREAGPQTSWRALGDTTLTRLVGAAIEANRDVVAAEARIAAARATRVEAALDLAPRITADAGYSRQRLASATMPGLDGS